MAYVIPAARSKYVVPKDRQVNPLAPENFPEFGSTYQRLSRQNFLAQVLKGEDRRLSQKKESIYDPTKIQNLTHSQLRNEGWEVLVLKNSKSWFIGWNERLVTGPKVIPRVPNTVVVPAVADDDSEYYDDDNHSEDSYHSYEYDEREDGDYKRKY
jgi:hypothetical protein